MMLKSSLTPLNMLMCKQMILTVFIITVTFGTETEFQSRIILFRSSANCAFMLGHTAGMSHLCIPHLCLKYILSMHFFWRYPLIISGRQIENQEVQKVLPQWRFFPLLRL